MNSFRQSANAGALRKHDKAECVADEIADKLEDRSCASMQSQLISDYPSVLKKCKVDVNTTTDGMILPVCVPHQLHADSEQRQVLERLQVHGGRHRD